MPRGEAEGTCSLKPGEGESRNYLLRRLLFRLNMVIGSTAHKGETSKSKPASHQGAGGVTRMTWTAAVS